MECIYATLLLHHAGQEINEENLRKVLKAANIEPDEVKIKSLLAALSEIDLEEALKSAAAMPMAPAAPAAAPTPAEEKKEEEKVEEKKEEEEEEALEGLSALFG
ncbi:MAG: 50S ribosomal protein L7/L12 [Candidatus Bathyarchaeota archaeon B24]|nr:MAG: 50S ribosomal protein L7/L12 [Candidatus Bathyarchaeota archaeon B24]MCD6444055.1 50S ribosomal protein P1 [Candidatus Bathyarchaeota archaeon]RLI26750.1 MAG: 50S ribosomal protein P1 [Candidatus Bathyarchaeota archaeon]